MTTLTIYFLIGGCLFTFFGWLFWGRDSKEYKEHQKNQKKYIRKKKLEHIHEISEK